MTYYIKSVAVYMPTASLRLAAAKYCCSTQNLCFGILIYEFLSNKDPIVSRSMMTGPMTMTTKLSLARRRLLSSMN